MQKISRGQLIKKASDLLSSGVVKSVLGWKRGEFDYDITPAVFTDEKELISDLVYNGFCGANLSKYLVSKAQGTEGKILVFLKPCDTYSFNQLLTEHKFDREKAYAVGIPCEGMADIDRIKEITNEGIASVDFKEDAISVKTLYSEEPISIPYDKALSERCINCKSKRHVAYDELLGSEGEVIKSSRFD